MCNVQTVATGPWYSSRPVGDDVTLFWEPYVHSFAQCNIWYVRGKDRDLLIDSGTGLLPLTPALSLLSGRPIIAVATHGHFDHIGALHEFSDRRAHVAEAADFATMPDALTYADWFRGLDQPVDALPVEGWEKSEYQIKPAPVHQTLQDGDVIDLGSRQLTVLHLPGHSPGSVGFFEEQTGMLFSGDALYDGQLLDDLATSNVAHYEATMHRLRDLPIRIGHGGHGASFDDRRKLTLVEEYLQGKRLQGCPIGP